VTSTIDAGVSKCAHEVFALGEKRGICSEQVEKRSHSCVYGYVYEKLCYEVEETYHDYGVRSSTFEHG
jgi:hypothetical protein